MYGLLNLNKPRGKTSRDVVNRVQRLVRPAKVGHAGTLDPIATGVLVVCVGPATRLIQYVQQLPKLYRGTFLLGQRSVSDDVESELKAVENAIQPTLADINAALPQFVGTIQQTPPAFSAVKVKGRRAYDLARAGKEVHIEPRPVTIHEIKVARYDYPELVLDICCGSGTYIRSVGRDLAESLGTAAAMSELVRTAIGELTVESAICPNDLTSELLNQHLIGVESAVSHLPRVELTDDEIIKIGNGLTIERSRHGFDNDTAAFDNTGQLVAIVSPRNDDQLRPVCNLAVAAKFARK